MAKGDGIHKKLGELIENNRIGFWTAQKVAYQNLEEQERFASNYLAVLEETSTNKKSDGEDDEKGKGKGSDDEPAPEPSPKTPRRRKIRAISELLEKLDFYAKMPLDDKTDAQRAHIWGIMKGLYWALNNQIEWPPMDPEKWGFKFEPLDE
jgi:hypothetical protein